MNPLDDAYLTAVGGHDVMAVPEIGKRSCRGCTFLGKNASGFDTCTVAEDEDVYIRTCGDENIIFIRPDQMEAYVTEWVAWKLE